MRSTKAAKRAKDLGAKDLNEIAAITGKHRTTLTQWYNKNPVFFDCVVMGAVRVRDGLGRV